MGLETVVLNKIAEVNPELANNAYFYDGTLFIRNSGYFNAVDIYRVMNAIKSVVTCELDLSLVGSEYAIDFL
jgi:hypothetical protein